MSKVRIVWCVTRYYSQEYDTKDPDEAKRQWEAEEDEDGAEIVFIEDEAGNRLEY